ncbi:TlpA family protein disulfide reductase [Actinoplanes utahensis]|uniref:TlpA family protein disulfide reductase n=1 Tax=Actinoplanes utahensis TaxID=1869 RepID=UPI000691D017|nr:TlpA disulfide reductase family protein [Actinoplanes utahensis]GIF33468.1 hypothetical protein Aut01nite_64540 [Actinoplanes utahensis]
MSYLAAAVTLAGLLGIVNLLLSFGVIRRLRKHSELLARQAADAHGPDGPLMLAAGQVAAPFEATANDGGAVSLASFTGQTLVGFFSPGCSACEERMPSFLAYANDLADPSRVLAVVVGKPDRAEPLVAELSPVARVVQEASDGAVADAFAIRGFPSFLLVDPDGTVAASSLVMTELPVPAAA